MAKLKFGSPAWRKKYAAKAARARRAKNKRTNPTKSGHLTAREQRAYWKKVEREAKREEAKIAKRERALLKKSLARERMQAKKWERDQARKRTNKPNTYTKKGAAAKRKRLKEMIRKNPPRSWTKVKAVRVVRKGGRDVLEIRK
jgi:hypothetical protein